MRKRPNRKDFEALGDAGSDSSKSDTFLSFSETMQEEKRRRRLKLFGLDQHNSMSHKAQFRHKEVHSDYVTGASSGSGSNLEEGVETGQPIVGTCQELEKPYLRLTSEVDPATVRPLAVLKAAFEHVLHRWDTERDYLYLCEQMQSIRQDLLVQQIYDAFSVLVYETHARIALQNGDIAEFTKCLSKLRPLYEDYALGSVNSVSEFLAYRLLLHLKTQSNLDLSLDIQRLTAKEKAVPAVSHALQLCQSWASKNHFQFFKLYKEAPNLGRFLIDTFLPQTRAQFLQAMAAAYKELEITFVQDIMVFPSEEITISFVQDHGFTLDETKTKFSTKSST